MKKKQFQKIEDQYSKLKHTQLVTSKLRQFVIELFIGYSTYIMDSFIVHGD